MKAAVPKKKAPGKVVWKKDIPLKIKTKASPKAEIWVWLEMDGETLVTVGAELLGKARGLADQAGMLVTAIVMGHGLSRPADEAIRGGADRVLVMDHPGLVPYTTTPYTTLMAWAIQKRRPEILLMGATHNGRDLAGRLAVRLKTGLTADCTDLELDPATGLLKSWVVGFGGGVAACIVCPQHRPQMATVRPGVFPVSPRHATGGELGLREGVLERVEVGALVNPSEKVLQRHRKEQKDITQAKVLMIGGRGVQGRFDLLHELARQTGGDVGATRVAVDAGWITREYQIGQTGVVTRPETAVVFGASGATHFTVGIEKAKTVIAVNNDPGAPMFDQADYIVVGDAVAVMTALQRELSAVKIP